MSYPTKGEEDSLQQPGNDSYILEVRIYFILFYIPITIIELMILELYTILSNL